jgi:F-type H+-transporting ATPase subunit a
VELSPDMRVFWSFGVFKLNLTILMTWLVMILMTGGAAFITRRLKTDVQIPRWQGLLEIIVSAIEKQIVDVGLPAPRRYLPFLGTIFLFVGVSSLLTIIPGYVAPTGSLSTTAALALAVFVAVPVFGIGTRGAKGYLSSYLQPTPLMLPFNLIGELSRTLALAIRLFGNVMSGTMITAILLTITPFLFPAIMTLFGLLTGLIQAYIFTVLAAVFIAAATQAASREPTASTSLRPQDAVHE